MPFGVGPFELVVLAVIVLIIFGVGRLPELGAGLGRAIKDFRSAVRDEGDSPQAEGEPRE